LEEFSKIFGPGIAAHLERIRYRSYTVHRAVETTASSLIRLDRVRLYVLVDGRPSQGEFRRLIGTLAEADVDAIQLRDKSLNDRQLLERARIARDITSSGRTLLIVNDRPDLAALAGADGVHVGQEELTVKDARTIVGSKALVGVSTHSIAQACQAVLDGASYVGVGPTYPSQTKDFEGFPGLELLRTVAAEIQLPAFAIGGITRGALPEVVATGVRRVAVCGAVVNAPDPGAAARALRADLEG
jgi:thiamine-phosphate pyrophosphorylase